MLNDSLLRDKIIRARSSLAKMHIDNISDSVIKKYSLQYRQLSHVRVSKNTHGNIYSIGGKIKAMINLEKKDDGYMWIQGLEIYGDAKGKGLSYGLIDVAVKDMHATNLSVNKSNLTAKKLYDAYGFKTYDEDSYMYYMRI